MESKKILVIGSTVADVIVNISHMPKTAEDVNAYLQTTSLGGCAYNVSDMIRHFGAPYTLFSPIGTGIYGDYVRSQLKLKGVTPFPLSPENPNGCCYCFVEESGERTFICHRGAEYIFDKEWFDQVDTSEIGSAYICGLEVEDISGPVIADFLEDNPSIQAYFAPGPRINHIDKDLMHRIFGFSPILHLNREESLSFTGTDTIEEAAKQLYSYTNNTVVITDSAGGSYAYDGEIMHHAEAVPAKQVVDTIGAGDSHCGAVIACLTLGMTIDEALHKANKAASLVVENKGATIPHELFIKEL